MKDWLERAAWHRRLPGIGPLRIAGDHGDPTVMIETELSVTEQPGALWRGFRPSPTLLEGAWTDNDHRLLLRYAAIDWSHQPVIIDGPVTARRVARWGVELARAFDFLVPRLPVKHRALFASPMVFVDLADRVRVGFFVSDQERLPPELASSTATEVSFIYVVGRLLHDLVDFEGGSRGQPLELIAKRCTLQDPQARFASLAELSVAFGEVGGYSEPPSKSRWKAWLETEAGIGYLQLSKDHSAHRCFTTALAEFPDPLAQLGMFELVERRGGFVAEPRWTWDDSALREREAARDFAGALAILDHTRAEQGTRCAINAAYARCYLASGNLSKAIDAARRVFIDEPDNLDAHRVGTLALVVASRFSNALAASDAWLERAPDDGFAHHTRGRILKALGRPLEARACFDRAAQLSPGLIAAAFSRTNLDRSARSLRALVGTEGYRTLEVPPHLAEVAPLLSKGRLLDAILWLTDRYEDVGARHLLATCHEYAGDYEAALAIHQHDTDTAGAARCLIALDRAEEVLTVTDDAELRADALDQLGRTEEASEIREHIAWNKHP